MQFPPIKKQPNNDHYVKNITKKPQGKPSVIGGVNIQGGTMPAEFRQTMKHNSSN
jgi:hypothetical protein